MLVAPCAMASPAGGTPAGGGMYMPVSRNNYNVPPVLQEIKYADIKYSSFSSPPPHSHHPNNLNGHPYSSVPAWMSNEPLQWSMNVNVGGPVNYNNYYTSPNFANSTSPNVSIAHGNGIPQHGNGNGIGQHCYGGSLPGHNPYLQQTQQSPPQAAQQQHQHVPTSPPAVGTLGHYVNSNYGHIMHHPSESTSPNLVSMDLINRPDGSMSSGEDELNADAPSSDDLEAFAKQFKQRRIKLGTSVSPSQSKIHRQNKSVSICL